jgi:hypothetical protein
MFQAAPSGSGAVVQPSSSFVAEPGFERFGMPAGGSVTSPLLQSLEACAPSDVLPSGQSLDPLIAESGTSAFSAGTLPVIDSAISSQSSSTVNAAQASNEDFLNSMFQAAPSGSGAVVQPSSSFVAEPGFERFGMPAGGSVTSPLLQSLAEVSLSCHQSLITDKSIASQPADVCNGCLTDLTTNLPEVTSSHGSADRGICEPPPSTQSSAQLLGDVAECLVSHSIPSILSDAIVSTRGFDTGLPNALHLRVSDVDVHSTRSDMAGTAVAKRDLKEAVSHSSPPQMCLKSESMNAPREIGTSIDEALSLQGLAAVRCLADSADAHIPVFSMDRVEQAAPMSPPLSPLKICDKGSPSKSFADHDVGQPPEWDLGVSSDSRDKSHNPDTRKKKSAFGSIGNFLSGFISQKAVQDRVKTFSASENLNENPHFQNSACSPPLRSHEVDSTLEPESQHLDEHEPTVRQYQLIRLPIGSTEKVISSLEPAANVQHCEGSDFRISESKFFIGKLSYDKLLDALSEQKQQPHLCVVIVCDSKFSRRESSTVRSSIQTSVSEPIASGTVAPVHASSVASSRATSPVPLVSDPHFWRSHVFLDQSLVSQHISRPCFDQIEQECILKCNLFRFDKLDADPTSDVLSAKFRDVIKHGVPMACRRLIWLRLSGLKEEELPALQELYHNRLITYLGENGPTRIIRYLPHFGQQILWENAHLINESGRNAAFRILTVVALAHQTKLAFFPMLQDLVGCLLCFLSESETFFVIDGLIKSELSRIEAHEESFPVVLLSTASESLIAGFLIESLRQDMKDVAQTFSQATVDIDGKPSWDSASPYLWGMLQGWLRNIWVGHAPLDLAFRSVDLILMKAFDQLCLLKLAVLEHLSTALKKAVAVSPSSGETHHGAGIMPMLKALSSISPSEIHTVAQRGLFEIKINPMKALARVMKSKVSPPVPASPLAPQPTRSGPKFLGDHTIHYLPKPLPSSSIVKDEHFEFIWRHLDERFKPSEDVRRVFNSREHGLSLTVCLQYLFFPAHFVPTNARCRRCLIAARMPAAQPAFFLFKR